MSIITFIFTLYITLLAQTSAPERCPRLRRAPCQASEPSPRRRHRCVKGWSVRERPATAVTMSRRHLHGHSGGRGANMHRSSLRQQEGVTGNSGARQSRRTASQPAGISGRRGKAIVSGCHQHFGCELCCDPIETTPTASPNLLRAGEVGGIIRQRYLPLHRRGRGKS